MGIVGALVLGSILTAVIGGASVYANYQQNQQNMAATQYANEQNIAMQQEINDKNWEEQWKMWNATNEYNKPVNQMQRFAEAGLNPNLIYGQSNTTQPMSVSSGQAAQVNPVLSEMDYNSMNKHFTSIIDNLMKIPMFKAQFENLDLENDSKRLAIDMMGSEYEKNKVYERMWLKLQTDDKLFGKLYDAWSNSLIDQAKSAGIKNRYVDAQTRVHDVMARIKEIDFSHTESKWEYELKAMEIANDLKQIDFDWAEFDKEIAAANGITKWFMVLIKTFAGRR